ncbi:MFS transporter [Bradyrhizobium iriomotense]|uniref:MFS transporter n=1 Tax=Bradyrhizobium iriomotense TaxID=441950 RepID=UPI0024E0F79F|nr:MFS transporter [Bradyrhizobium iriomotense]
MKTEPRKTPAPISKDDKLVVAALGAAEIISYGTLYYSVAVVANAVGQEFAVTDQWIFACFSSALFASALMSLIAGRLMDRYGAGITMKVASLAATVSLGLAALSWNALVFAVALFGMQISSAFLFYEAAFVFLVQRDAGNAKQQITLLTLIVGFSSTLFWPLTSLLLIWSSWRTVFGIYAGCNALIALPLVVCALRRCPARSRNHNYTLASRVHSQSSPTLIDLALITVGFSLTTFIFSAFLGRMIPILSSIGLDLEQTSVSALFGPSQVLIRIFAASLTERMTAIQLTILSSILLSAATIVVELSSRSVLGATIFTVLLGFSSGLNSICRGILPLSVFGRDGYGKRVGLINGFRLLTASFAPFLFTSIQSEYGIAVALALLAACGVGSILAFALVCVRPDDQRVLK